MSLIHDATTGVPLTAGGGLEDARLRDAALEAATNGIVIVDARAHDQPIVFVNGGFCRMTGYTAEEVMGRNCRFLQSASPDREANADFRSAIDERRATTVRVRNVRRDGSPFSNQVTISPMRDETGTTTHYVGVLADVSEQVAAEQRASFLALCDPLTGLWNRRALQERLAARCALADAGAGAVALLYVDLDDFKAVNDEHGHHTGDALLQGVAHRLQGALARSGYLARQGGDEFSVVLDGGPDIRDEAHDVADRLLQAFARPIEVQGLALATSASVGLSVYPHDALSPDDLLRHADHAMYVAKRRGGGRSASWPSGVAS